MTLKNKIARCVLAIVAIILLGPLLFFMAKDAYSTNPMGAAILLITSIAAVWSVANLDS